MSVVKEAMEQFDELERTRQCLSVPEEEKLQLIFDDEPSPLKTIFFAPEELKKETISTDFTILGVKI